MINVLNRRTLAALAAAAFLSLTAACGGGDSSVTADSGGSGGGAVTGSSDKSAICADAVKAFNDFTAAAAKGASDLDAFNKASEDLSATLKELAGRAEGELKSTLDAMSGTMGNLKIDPANPVESASKLSEFTQQATEQGTKLSTACA